MLTEPALMVGAHGTFQFDHAKYREMAEKGPMVLRSYELSDMNVVLGEGSRRVEVRRAYRDAVAAEVTRIA